MNLRLLLFMGIWMFYFANTQSQIGTAPSSGDGSAGNPYQIATLENLYWLSQNSDYWGDNFIQTASIDASETENWDDGKGFSPIGNDNIQFSGSYMGQGNVLNNLFIYREDEDYIGLFGFIKNAEIDSLVIDGCDIKGGNYVGSLIGYNTTSDVSNCNSTGFVYGSDFVGGILGVLDGECEITECYNAGTVSGIGATGGLAGLSSGSSIENCYNTGVVSTNSSAGGIVAYNFGGTLSYSYNTGTVNGGDYSGGLVGYNMGATVSFCYNSGTVSGGSYLGGIVGMNQSLAYVKVCYNTGYVSGDSYVGGLVGYSIDYVVVKNCYSTGAIYGELSGGSVVGRSQGSRSLVSNCYYNIETSGHSSGVGSGDSDYYNEYDEDYYIDPTIGLTTDEMRQSNSFSSTFISNFDMIEGKTYPVIESIDNAPFTFKDTVNNGSFTATSLLENDYDYETSQENLTCKIDSVGYNDTDTDLAEYLKSVNVGDSLKIVYRSGEIRSAQNDTLWGNQMASYLVYKNTTYIDVAYETNEDTPVYLPELTETYSKIPFDILDYPDHGVVDFVNDSLFYFPDDNFYGIEFGRVRYSGLNVDLYVNYMCKVHNVNDAPVITSTAETVATENEVYTYTLTAEDVDDDVLSYRLSNEPEGMTIDASGLITWTPSANSTTSGEVTAIVSDGELSDSEVFTVSVDTDGTTTIKNTKQSEVQIYPNPVQTSFYVSGVSGMAELSVYNALGGLVKYVSSIETGSSVDVTELSNGIYVVKIKDENGVATIKINKM